MSTVNTKRLRVTVVVDFLKALLQRLRGGTEKISEDPKRIRVTCGVLERDSAVMEQVCGI